MPVGLQAGSCCTAARLAGTPTGRFIPRQLQPAMTTPVLGGREGDAISRSRLEGSWAGGTSVAPSGASSCTAADVSHQPLLHAAHAHHTRDTKHTPPHVKQHPLVTKCTQAQSLCTAPMENRIGACWTLGIQTTLMIPSVLLVQHTGESQTSRAVRCECSSMSVFPAHLSSCLTM